jgi:hypothetical protein
MAFGADIVSRVGGATFSDSKSFLQKRIFPVRPPRVDGTSGHAAGSQR